MQKLWLKFKDEDDNENRIEVDRDVFTIGRHSECSLVYRDSRLSREHLRIIRDGAGFTASDQGSSNGTTLNGQKLTSPRPLKEGDVLDLGGGLDIAVEVQASPDVVPPPVLNAGLHHGVPDVSTASASPPLATTPAGSGIPASFFIIAPLLAILVLAMVVGAVVLFGRGGANDPSNPDDIAHASTDEDSPPEGDDSGDRDKPEPSRSAIPAPSVTPGNSGPAVSASPIDAPPVDSLPSEMEEVRKVEGSAAVFLKKIAENDSNPFITGEQARRVNARIKQISRMPSLAGNIKSANAGAARIKSLAVAKNLNPYFLAVAGITKLGSSRGDTPQTVDSIAGTYDGLAVPIGNRLADDVLLMVAAYDQGAAGANTKLRDTIEALTNQDKTTNPRQIRTIWYLEKAGKLTPAEFDRALTFLAIGTIAQNPKEFGVNTEPLRL